MRVFKDTLKQLFQEKFKGVIWKVVADPHELFLTLEIRDPAEKQVTFACLDINAGILLWKDLKTPESWLHSLVAAYKGISFIQGYASGHLPMPLGIIAIKSKTGVILWENYADTFAALLPDGIAVYNARIEPKTFRVLDIQSGAFLRKAGLQEMQDSVAAPLDFPESATLDHAEQEVLSSYVPGQLINEVELLIREDKKLVSFYAENGKLFDQYLAVFNPDKDILLLEKLASEAAGKTIDSFFIWENRLFYIKNKSELAAYLV